MKYKFLLRIIGFEIIFVVFPMSASGAISSLFTINNGDARVRQWSPANGSFVGDPVILTLSGNPFNNSSDIEWDGNFYYGIRAGDPRVMRFDSVGRYIDDVALLTDQFGPVPNQVGFAYDGSFYYSIAANDARIRRYTLAGNFAGDFANLIDGAGLVTTAIGLSKDNDYFYTTQSGSSIVQKFNLNGQYVGDLVSLMSGVEPFTLNTGIAIAPVPEPASVMLILFSFMSVLIRRERRF